MNDVDVLGKYRILVAARGVRHHEEGDIVDPSWHAAAELLPIVDALASRCAELEAALRRATVLAKGMHEMIDRDTWRAHGGDDQQGHYEGDYHAEQIWDEIESWATLAPTVETDTRKYAQTGGPENWGAGETEAGQ